MGLVKAAFNSTESKVDVIRQKANIPTAGRYKDVKLWPSEPHEGRVAKKNTRLLVQKLGLQNELGMTNTRENKKTNMKNGNKEMLVILKHLHNRDRGEYYHNQTLNRPVHMVQVTEVIGDRNTNSVPCPNVIPKTEETRGRN